jgi:hypothetical protein
MDEDNCMMGRSALLPRVHGGRELRQVHAVPYGRAVAGNVNKSQRATPHEDLDKRKALPLHQSTTPLRPRPNRAEPVLSTLKYFRESMLRTWLKNAARQRLQKACVSIDPTSARAARFARASARQLHRRKVKEPHVFDQSKCINAALAWKTANSAPFKK